MSYDKPPSCGYAARSHDTTISDAVRRIASRHWLVTIELTSSCKQDETSCYGYQGFY